MNNDEIFQESNVKSNSATKPLEDHRKKLLKRFHAEDPDELIKDRKLMIDVGYELQQEIMKIFDKIIELCNYGLEADNNRDKDNYYQEIIKLIESRFQEVNKSK